MLNPSTHEPKSNRLSVIGIALGIVVGCCIGLGTFTFYYGKGFSYFSKDPTSCTNCHIMNAEFDAWQKSSHHGVASCVDCHLPHDFIGKWIAKAENGYFHSKAFTFQDFKEPITIKPKNSRILYENCMNCHTDMVSDLVHEKSSGSNTLDCIHCHRTVGHGNAPKLGGYNHISETETSPKKYERKK